MGDYRFAEAVDIVARETIAVAARAALDHEPEDYQDDLPREAWAQVAGRVHDLSTLTEPSVAEAAAARDYLKEQS